MPLGQCRVDFNINLQEVEILLCQGLIDKPTATAINKALRLRRITGVERRQLLPLDIIAKATDIKTRETSHFMVSVFRITHSVDRQRAAVPASICAKSLERRFSPWRSAAAYTPATRTTLKPLRSQ